MISRYQDEVTVDDESFAKMSGGDVDVEPFLVSRNTLGNDEPQLKVSKPESKWWYQSWQCGSEIVCGKRWWYAEDMVEGLGKDAQMTKV